MGDGVEWSNAEDYPGYLKWTAQAYQMLINEVIYSLTTDGTHDMKSPISPRAWPDGRERILHELRKVIVGQDEVVDQVLMALFTGGHCLLTGVPGLAKTLLIKTLAEILDLSFKRIQFTPDLMPADITGTEILDEEGGRRALRFLKGPIFAQIILADEINRTPPKTQAALLEAMQEYHVTAAGRTYDLERPFFVLATQNPIELEGTYPLPEAQLDRFMFNVVMTYLSPEDEVRVVTQTTGAARPPADACARRRAPSWLSGERARSARRRRNRALRGPPRRQHAARPRRQARVRAEVGEVGRRPARVAGADPRQQGAGADARPSSRVGQGRPGAGQADPPPPRHSRTSTPKPKASRPTASSSSCSRPCPRRPAACSRRHGPTRARAFSTRPRSPGSATLDLKARTIVEGFLSRSAPQPVQGLQRRVRGVPPVLSRRRSRDARLEGLRARPIGTSSRSSRKKPTSTATSCSM